MVDWAKELAAELVVSSGSPLFFSRKKKKEKRTHAYGKPRSVLGSVERHGEPVFVHLRISGDPIQADFNQGRKPKVLFLQILGTNAQRGEFW